MKVIFSYFLCYFLVSANAQKFDRNWVFGTNAGMSFLDDSIFTFTSSCNNYEMSTSFSDESGELLFYLSGVNLDVSTLKNNDAQVISNGNNIMAYKSSSGGAIVLKVNTDTFFLFSLGRSDSISTNCPQLFCTKLYLTVIKKEGTNFSVEEKNRLLSNDFLHERMAAVKHANGEDWWLLVQDGETLSNKIARFLISDTVVSGPLYQNMGTQVDTNEFIGEFRFSKSGNQFASAIFDLYRVDLFNFDRCTGLLSNHQSISIGNSAPYSCEFSPNEKYLYVTTAESAGNSLYQIDLTQPTPSIFQLYTFNKVFGDLLLAPDSMIYMANQNTGSSTENIYNQYNQNLSIISSPDSLELACDFQPFSFYLGDSSKSTLGLPNMPNYNLGALSIYQADAGIDTVICTEDTTVKGVLLGVPAVSDVAYSWHPSDSLNHTNIAQPFANPTVSTWYHLTVTDTSIKYSCQSRVDSVWVEVKDCSVGINEATQKQLLLFPNPTNGFLQLETTAPHKITHINLHDITGKLLQQFQNLPIDISGYATGAYILSIRFNDGTIMYRKVVKR